MAKPWDLRERTMGFAVAVFAFCRALPRTDEANDVARQLRRAAASVAANWRAARRASSNRLFAAKTAIVIEEADESGFWLELLVRSEIVSPAHAAPLQAEASELVAIFTASRKTAVAGLAAKKDR